MKVIVDNFVTGEMKEYSFASRYEMDCFLTDFHYNRDEEEVSISNGIFGMFLEDYYCL